MRLRKNTQQEFNCRARNNCPLIRKWLARNAIVESDKGKEIYGQNIVTTIVIHSPHELIQECETSILMRESKNVVHPF